MCVCVNILALLHVLILIVCKVDICVVLRLAHLELSK